jgi:hypothetical protein
MVAARAQDIDREALAFLLETAEGQSINGRL